MQAKKMLKIETKIDKKEPKTVNKAVMAKHDKIEPKKLEKREEKLLKTFKK